MATDQYVIGIDFGTDSVRAILVHAGSGATIASHVHGYQRWKQGQYCNPVINQYRQHPLDHIEGLEATITTILQTAQIDPGQVKGMGIDTTGSSPIALNREGQPLCFVAGMEENSNAMMILWKDHTAIREAEEINQLARSWGGEDFTKFAGGIYSSEWFWAKILHVIRDDAMVKEAVFSWMEHCDFMTYLLIGSPPLALFKRSRCAAGHKAMWHERWGGLPEDAFLAQLDESFPTLKKHLYSETYTSDEAAGYLSSEWAARLGLREDTVVAVGTFDAHAGAIGAEIAEHTLVRIMGTSTCDIIVASPTAIGERTIKGICGQVDGSVLPGMIGLEAGQSAFGDVLAWFKEIVSWPIDQFFAGQFNLSDAAIEEVKAQIISKLAEEAAALPITDDIPVALDWVNGRRTPDANQALQAAIMNINLGTKAPAIFRALVEAICFGSKMIVDRFVSEGVRIDTVIGIGGVAKKSPFIMQTLADVLGMPIKIARSDQAPALGAAMYAAAAAAIYDDLNQAIKVMGNGFEKTYHPSIVATKAYDNLFQKYKSLGAFVEGING